MNSKDKISAILLTILVSIFCLIPIYDFKIYAKEVPKSLFKVYLNGKSIGIIESKEKLENYINEEQKDLKEKYNVDTVYAPNGLYIVPYTTYNENIVDEKYIYDVIKKTENFTIKGYEITITRDDTEDSKGNDTDINSKEESTNETSNDSDEAKDVSFYVLSKDDFKNAVSNVVKAFVDADDLEAFLSGEEIVIKSVGNKIEDLYIKEDITIKEKYISTDNKIYLDEKEITKFLLFGKDVDEKKYKVKAGDTIESIADKNKLAVEELLVVNQDLDNKNNILSIGQEISVALISPIITVVEEEHKVEEKTISYTTTIEYDSSMVWGATKIKQEGKDGSQIVTQKIKYENGEIKQALITNTELVEDAINQIKVIGTKNNYVVIPENIPNSGDWLWPTKSPYIITSLRGWRWGAFHDGIDISGTGHGSPIYAANNGTVSKVFYDGIGGYQVIIAHSDNIYTWYAHLASQTVKTGQEVKGGDKIGTMGCTGSACTGTHLHFATYLGIPGAGGTSFDPLTLYN
jgi:murein DD-endopeptidase MepM/ murein hydrolase activator NlpD